jgi:myo-inositol 2-dehydrogenase/D-chiro-inositol 1-dehydrogenase
MEQIEIAVIGTGWCRDIRTEACSAHPLCLHIAEVRPERHREVAATTRAR